MQTKHYIAAPLYVLSAEKRSLSLGGAFMMGKGAGFAFAIYRVSESGEPTHIGTWCPISGRSASLAIAMNAEEARVIGVSQ